MFPSEHLTYVEYGVKSATEQAVDLAMEMPCSLQRRRVECSEALQEVAGRLEVSMKGESWTLPREAFIYAESAQNTSQLAQRLEDFWRVMRTCLGDFNAGKIMQGKEKSAFPFSIRLVGGELRLVCSNIVALRMKPY